MTIWNRRAIRLLAFHAPLLPLLASCSRPQAVDVPADPPAVVLVPTPGAITISPEPQPTPAQPSAPIPAFVFPSDLTGQALPRVVAPQIPVKLPGASFGTEPQPRPVPAKILDPEVNSRTRYALPPILPAKSTAMKPAAPPEKVPINFGAGASVPPKPVLPVAAVVTERARDVNVPPPAPLLGRPPGDRVPFDDPTSELGNATIVAGGEKVPLGVSGFLRITLPDPFELGAQVKPNVPPAAEPSAAPVTINPQRVK